MLSTEKTQSSFDAQSVKSKFLLRSSILVINKNNFLCHYGIGRGGFGKVWKVDRRRKNQVFAMKEMSKARIITKRSIKSVMNER